MLAFVKPVTGLPRAVCHSLCSRNRLHTGSDKGESSGQIHLCSCCCVPEGKKHLLKGSGDSALVVKNDNACGLNYAGMKVFMSSLPNTEVLCVDFYQDTTHKPHGVFLDHDMKLVVITARGTLSLEDCITDALCEPCS
eukprot:gene1862-2437_t